MFAFRADDQLAKLEPLHCFLLEGMVAVCVDRFGNEILEVQASPVIEPTTRRWTHGVPFSTSSGAYERQIGELMLGVSCAFVLLLTITTDRQMRHCGRALDLLLDGLVLSPLENERPPGDVACHTHKSQH